MVRAAVMHKNRNFYFTKNINQNNKTHTHTHNNIEYFIGSQALMILGKAVTFFHIAKLHIAGDTKVISVLDCFSCAYFTMLSQVKFLHGVS